MREALYIFVVLLVLLFAVLAVRWMSRQPRHFSQRTGVRTGGVLGIALTIVYTVASIGLFGASVPALVYIVYVGLLFIGAGTTGGYLFGTAAHLVALARGRGSQT
jgi:hypothetical protein